MRVVVIRSFRDKETKREHRKRDVITISESRYEKLKGVFVEEVHPTTPLTPKRDEKGQCIICNKFKK